MTNLNIDDLPDDLYTRLQARARQHGRPVAQEVTNLLEQALEATEPLSILELKGLGKRSGVTWIPRNA